MSLVRIKNKYQVVIPALVRQEIGVEIGDMLEAKVERGKITLTPKSLVDRGIAASLEEFQKGRSFGPFNTHEEFIASLHKEGKKLRVKRDKHAAR